jgi:DNA-binding HxlR family transcriptional regulator
MAVWGLHDSVMGTRRLRLGAAYGMVICRQEGTILVVSIVNETMNIEDCPVTAALAVIGGKWKPLLLYQLRTGSMRFSELRRVVPHATQKMITQQLRELERDGVVSRKVHAVVPPKVEYALTSYGNTLKPVLNAMCEWGVMHRKQQASRRSRGKSVVLPSTIATA